MKCPICDAVECKVVGTANKVGVTADVYFCGLCETYFSENHSDEGQVAKFNSQEYPRATPSFYKRTAKAQVRWLRSELDFCKISSVLEIGCGMGFLLNELRRDAERVVGIEPDPVAVSYARERFKIEIIRQRFEEYSSDEKFDLVIISHFLEHVTHPVKVVDKIRNMLNEKGEIFIEVPNSQFEIPIINGKPFLGNSCSHHLFVYSSSFFEWIAKKLELQISVCQDCTNHFYANSVCTKMKIMENAYDLLANSGSTRVALRTAMENLFYAGKRYLLGKVTSILPVERNGGLRCILEKLPTKVDEPCYYQKSSG